MKNIKLVFLMFSIFLIHCSFEKDPLFIAKKKLEKELQEYNKKAKDVNEKIIDAEGRISESYENFKNIKDPKSNDLKKVSKKWESEYLNIAEEIDKLRKDFIDVQNSTGIYFKEIDVTLENLKEDEDYLELLKDTQKKKNEYNQEFEIAKNALDQIDKTISDIQNFDDKMRLYYALDNLDNQIKKLNQITSVLAHKFRYIAFDFLGNNFGFFLFGSRPLKRFS